MFREQTANRRWRASRRPIIPFVAVVLLAAGGLTARAAENVAPDPGPPAERASPGLAQAVPGVEVSAPLDAIIVTVNVNGVPRGTAPVLRDQKGRFFVPVADFRSWGLAVPGGATLRLQGIEHVDLGRVPELQARFDEKRVALEITVAAEKLPRCPAPDSVERVFQLCALRRRR
jgi:outer membrane usher protein FimD/PapC